MYEHDQPTTHQIAITPTCSATVTIRPLEPHELTADGGMTGVRCQIYHAAPDGSWSCNYSARQVRSVLTHADQLIGYRFDVVDPVGMNAAMLGSVLSLALAAREVMMSATSSSADRGQESSSSLSDTSEDHLQEHAPAAPAYPEPTSGTGDRFDGLTIGARVRIADRCSYRAGETGTVVEIVDARGSLPTAVYVRIDGADLPYRGWIIRHEDAGHVNVIDPSGAWQGGAGDATEARARIDDAVDPLVSRPELTPSGRQGYRVLRASEWEAIDATALDDYDLDSFVEGFVTAALWSDCEHVQTYAVDVSGDDDASDSGLSYDDAVAYVNELADDLESDGWTCDRSWASADNLYAVHATHGDAVRTVQVVRDEDPGSGGREDLTLDDESEEIVRAQYARFVAANRPDLDAYSEQRSCDHSQGSVESYAGHDPLSDCRRPRRGVLGPRSGRARGPSDDRVQAVRGRVRWSGHVRQRRRYGVADHAQRLRAAPVARGERTSLKREGG